MTSDSQSDRSSKIVLWSTETFATRVRVRLQDRSLPIEFLSLSGADLPDADSLARITAACLSIDAYPDRYGAVIRGCLESPNLAWMHTFSAGVDRPVFRTLMDRGVAVTTSSGSAASPIAQTVMMYLLALSRDLPAWFRAQQERRWEQRPIDELDGKSIGIVGLGPIGREVVRLASAFGMRPIAVRRQITGDEPCETWTFDGLPELVASVDALVLAVPLTESTTGLLDRRLIGLMRRDSVLVNVGRGGLIDEDALVDALRERRVAGAGLDVFVTEPLPTSSPLWGLENVIVTPHSSGLSSRADERAFDYFIDNVERWVDGRPLLNRADGDGQSTTAT